MNPITSTLDDLRQASKAAWTAFLKANEEAVNFPMVDGLTGADYARARRAKDAATSAYTEWVIAAEALDDRIWYEHNARSSSR